MTTTTTRPGTATVQVSVGNGSQVGVIPLHRGHHAVWASARHQADICNMIDDVVVRDLNTGFLYRFPIDTELLLWVKAFIDLANYCDRSAGSPWSDHNEAIRGLLVSVAVLRIDGNPPPRNIFEPGMVAPALSHGDGSCPVDDMLAKIIEQRPNAIVPEG